MKPRAGITIKKETGCGTVNFTFEKDSKLIIYPTFSGEGMQDCGRSWFAMIQDILKWALKNSDTIEELKSLAQGLRGHRCEKFTAGKCYSCTDAFAKALTDYVTIMETDEKGKEVK